MNEYYKAISEATGGKNLLLPVWTSTLTDLLDYSKMPKELKDEICERALNQIRLMNEPLVPTEGGEA